MLLCLILPLYTSFNPNLGDITLVQSDCTSVTTVIRACMGMGEINKCTISLFTFLECREKMDEILEKIPRELNKVCEV